MNPIMKSLQHLISRNDCPGDKMHRVFIVGYLVLALPFLLHMKAGYGSNAGHPGENMHLVTDRDVYITGEPLHFQAMLWQETAHNGPGSAIAYLVLRSPQRQVHAQAVRLTGGLSEGNFYLHDTLASGYYELVAFTNWMRNFGESAFARKTIFIANRFDRNLDVSKGSGVSHGGDPDSLASSGGGLLVSVAPAAGQRQQLMVELGLAGMMDAVYGIAVSVTLKHALFGDGIHTQPAPGTGAMPSETEATPAETHTTGNPVTYPMEAEGWVVSGRMSNAVSGQPERDARVFLSAPADQVNLAYAVTDTAGWFHMALPEAYRERELYLLPEHRLLADSPSAEEAPVIRIWDKFTLNEAFIPPAGPPPLSPEHLRRSQDLVRAMISYGIDPLTDAGVAQDTARALFSIYNFPNHTIFPDEYTRFETLHDIAREIISPWRIRQSDGTYSSSLSCHESRTLLPGSPLYFLDGILIPELHPLIGLGSDDIDRIEVHNLNWVYGHVNFPGVIGIFSRGGHIGGEYHRISRAIPFTRTRFVLQEKVRRLAYPSYGENEQHASHDKPDLRQLLLWEPGLALKAGESLTIPFYSGDLSDAYVVTATGFTREGRRVSARAMVRIRGGDPTEEVTGGSGNIIMPGATRVPVVPVHQPDTYTATAGTEVLVPAHHLAGNVFRVTFTLEGSPYIPGDWARGDVRLSNGKTVTGQLLRYHGMLDELIWLPGAGMPEVRTEKAMVDGFTLNHPEDAPPAVFEKITVPARTSGNGNMLFLQRLYDGGITLLAHRQVIQTRTIPRTVDGRTTYIPFVEPSPVYYLSLPGEGVRVLRQMNNRALLTLFPGMRDEINALLRAERIRIRTEEDLIRAVKLIDAKTGDIVQ